LPFETRLTIALPRNYLPIAFHSDALNVEKEKIQFRLVQSQFCLNPQIQGSEPSPKKS
jgi:hypothetical protein